MTFYKNFNFWLSSAIVLLSALFFFLMYGNIEFASNYIEQDLVRARVDTVDTEPTTTGEGTTAVSTVQFVATILYGEEKGTSVGATQYFDHFIPGSARFVEVGDTVMLYKTSDADALAGAWIFGTFDRTNIVILSIAVFLLAVILIGRKKGFFAILTLGFTLAAIFIVLIPSILAGYNVYLVTTGVVLYIIVMSLLLINGANNKTYCAIIGNIAGLILSGTLGYLAHKLFLITGITDQESIELFYTEAGSTLDLSALIWCGMLIGSLGAVMDVSMSLSSSMKELADNVQEKNRLALVKSGLTIGRDIIGTMMNTLVLAYVGSSLVSIMLIMIHHNTLDVLINQEFILIELLQSIIGSAGILLTVPLTVVISSYIFCKSGYNNGSTYKATHKNDEPVIIDAEVIEN